MWVSIINTPDIRWAAGKISQPSVNFNDPVNSSHNAASKPCNSSQV